MTINEMRQSRITFSLAGHRIELSYNEVTALVEALERQIGVQAHGPSGDSAIYHDYDKAARRRTEMETRFSIEWKKVERLAR